jgi:cytidylate kinase
MTMDDLNTMTGDEVYQARYEIAGWIVNARGLERYLRDDIETRARGLALRELIDLAESRLLSVTRP